MAGFEVLRNAAEENEKAREEAYEDAYDWALTNREHLPVEMWRSLGDSE